MTTEQKEGTGGTPREHHVPLEETLAKAAARLAENGHGKPVPRRRSGRPAPPEQAAPAPEPAAAAPKPANAVPKPAAATPKPANAAPKPAPAAPESVPAAQEPVSAAPKPAAAPTRPAAAAPEPSVAAASPTPTPARPPRAAPPDPPAEQMPRVGRTLLVASAVTLAGVAALLLGLQAYRAPDRATPMAALPAPVAAPAPAPTATPPAPPRPRVEVVQRTPGELSMLIQRAAQNGRAEIVHTVAPGETLWDIAGRYVHDPWAWQQLAASNGIPDANLIRPGDQIRIVFQERKP